MVRGTERKYEDTGRLDHIAFAATDVEGMRKRLQSKDVKFRESIVPRTGDTQFFLYDPDGVGVELNFPENLRPGCRRTSGLNLRPSRPGWFSVLWRQGPCDVGGQHCLSNNKVPDNAASQPSVRRESVRVSSSLQ